MIKLTHLLVLLVLLPACSFTTPQNQWQIKSTSAFNSYTKNYLNNNDLLAKNDLSRAIKHAKQSANLTQLAKIYLGKCALNKSVGIDATCQEFVDVSELVDSKELASYHAFIKSSFNAQDIKRLPSQYQNFAKAFLKKDFKNANHEIQNISKASSAFLCASLLTNELTSKTRKHILDLASFHGYKKVVLFYLHEAKRISKDADEIEKINKKILILNSMNISQM